MYRELPTFCPEEILVYLRKSRADEPSLSVDEVLAKHLAVMDTTATSLSMDNHIPVQVFALKDPQNILRVVMGEPIGTIVKEEL